MRILRLIIICLTGLSIIGCTGLSVSTAWVDGQAYRDDEIGLSKTSVFAIPSPDVLVHNTAESEDDAVLPRPYDISPPRIPHSVEDMVPIKRAENTCLECHESPRIPESHMVDLRAAPGKVAKKLYGARYNCTMCHVEKTGAEPLVLSDFSSE